MIEQSIINMLPTSEYDKQYGSCGCHQRNDLNEKYIGNNEKFFFMRNLLQRVFLVPVAEKSISNGDKSFLSVTTDIDRIPLGSIGKISYELTQDIVTIINKGMEHTKKIEQRICICGFNVLITKNVVITIQREESTDIITNSIRFDPSPISTSQYTYKTRIPRHEEYISLHKEMSMHNSFKKYTNTDNEPFNSFKNVLMNIENGIFDALMKSEIISFLLEKNPGHVNEDKSEDWNTIYEKSASSILFPRDFIPEKILIEEMRFTDNVTFDGKHTIKLLEDVYEIKCMTYCATTWYLFKEINRNVKSETIMNKIIEKWDVEMIPHL
jgi:hypothetical protein